MKIWHWALGILSILAGGVVALAVWAWDPLITPSYDDLIQDVDKYDVEIIRDDWGVPHIFGKTVADTSFGLGFAHAEDDFKTIQENVAATRGVLARYRGARAGETDYIISLLDIWGVIERRYENDVPEHIKDIAKAYAVSLNLYAAKNPDEVWPGLAPFTAEDVIAGFILKGPLFYNMDSKLLKLFGEDYTQEIALDPSDDRGAWLVSPRSRTERGSNAMAVAPARSGDGATRLMINTHLPLKGPVAWYEAHMVAEDEGMDIMGGLFPGTPLVLHGFNRKLGWASTVSAQDLIDVFVLEINPDNELQYRLDGEWRDFEISFAKINVKLAGPFAYKAKQRVLRSVHGPVIEAPHGTYAVRYAGMNEVRQLEQYYELNKANSFSEFNEAMSILAFPSINYVYADYEGNIAFMHNAQYPNRDNRWDWSGDLPGDRSELVWQGYRPWFDVPKLINPQSGLVFNANNRADSATDGPDNLDLSTFPESMGLQTNENNRSLRLMEINDGVTPIGRAELLAMKFDTAYAKGSDADVIVKTILAKDWSAEPELEKAAEHLAGWDYHLEVDSRHAALGGLTVIRQVTKQYTGRPAPEPEVAFRESVEFLMIHYGRIDPTWGEVNRLYRGEASLPISGGSDVLRAVYPDDNTDDGKLKMAGGDTWMALVEWDAAGNVQADLVHQYGSATLDKTSKHFGDQSSLFAEEKFRRALFDRAAIEAVATRTYRPTD